MQTIGLISCTKRKHTEPMPARDIYGKSPYFRKQRTLVENRCDKFFILSAKHYVLKPGEIIEYYNQEIQNPHEWAQSAYPILDLYLPDQAKLIITAGKKYTDGLVPVLKEDGYTIEMPLKGLKFGPSLAKLNELNNG